MILEFGRAKSRLGKAGREQEAYCDYTTRQQTIFKGSLPFDLPSRTRPLSAGYDCYMTIPPNILDVMADRLSLMPVEA